MKSETFNTIILTAEEGHCLTQTADVDIKERIVATTVALGKFSTAEDWKEITKEEGDALIAAQKEAIEKELPME